MKTTKIATLICFGWLLCASSQLFADVKIPTASFEGVNESKNSQCLFEGDGGTIKAHSSSISGYSMIVDFRTVRSGRGFFYFDATAAQKPLNCEIFANIQSDRKFKVLFTRVMLPMIKYGDTQGKVYGGATVSRREDGVVLASFRGNDLADAERPTATFTQTTSNDFSPCAKVHDLKLGFSLFADIEQGSIGVMALNAPMYTVVFDYKACQDQS